MTRDYPKAVCWDCGNKYRARPGSGIGITVSKGTCGVCNEEKLVSPPYDYGGLTDEWREHVPSKTDAVE